MNFKTKQPEVLNLLLVGNNPLEMSSILEKINKVPGQKIITEIAFDLNSVFQRLIHFKPNHILIDDNVGKFALSETIKALAENRKTKDVSITVLKNSNYEEAHNTSTFLDYILKQNFSSDSLFHLLKNSLKFKRTQLYLQQAYSKRRNQLTGLVAR